MSLKISFKYFFLLAAVLCLSACNLFQNSLSKYLLEYPAELRIKNLFVEATLSLPPDKFQYPLEPLGEGRSDYTCVVNPDFLIGPFVLNCSVEDPSSSINSGLPGAPLNQMIFTTSPPPLTIKGQSVGTYTANSTLLIIVQAANGIQKTYTITIIWARLIDNVAGLNEMRTHPTWDYYLRPGPPITLNAWTPIASGGFSGTLRGNGRTIIINSFVRPAAPNNGNHGLFDKLTNALIEDLHVQLNNTEVNAKWAGGIAGEATGSLIQRVRVSGGLWVHITNVTGTSIDAGGIVGHLSNQALIYNSVSTVDVSATIYSGFGGDPYIGGINGAIDTSTGGNILYCYATGAINGTGNTRTRTGGISGGGGGAGALKVQYSVARNTSVIGYTNQTNYVSAQWSGITGAAGNLYWQGMYFQGTPPPSSYETIPSLPFPGSGGKSAADLSNPATYYFSGSDYWDFTNVWKMSGGYPVLIWE
jgi:hypothetical protein